MSNQIYVKVNGKIRPYSFKWNGDVLLAWINNEWRAVWRTEKKNKQRNFIFTLASEL